MGYHNIENTTDRRKGCLCVTQGRTGPATSSAMRSPGYYQHAGCMEQETESHGGGRERNRHTESKLCRSFFCSKLHVSVFGLQSPGLCLALNRCSINTFWDKVKTQEKAMAWINKTRRSVWLKFLGRGRKASITGPWGWGGLGRGRPKRRPGDTFSLTSDQTGPSTTAYQILCQGHKR